MSARWTIEFTDPAHLVRQIRDYVYSVSVAEKSSLNRARTLREKTYFEGRLSSLTQVTNLLDILQLEQIEERGK